jgi:Ankyrin repeats (3 copies)
MEPPEDIPSIPVLQGDSPRRTSAEEDEMVAEFRRHVICPLKADGPPTPTSPSPRTPLSPASTGAQSVSDSSPSGSLRDCSTSVSSEPSTPHGYEHNIITNNQSIGCCICTKCQRCTGHSKCATRRGKEKRLEVRLGTECGCCARGSSGSSSGCEYCGLCKLCAQDQPQCYQTPRRSRVKKHIGVVDNFKFPPDAAIEGHGASCVLCRAYIEGARISGRTALHHASGSTDQLTCILYLVTTLGFELDARDDNGETPLNIAAQAGRPNVTCALIKLGATVDMSNNQGR